MRWSVSRPARCGRITSVCSSGLRRNGSHSIRWALFYVVSLGNSTYTVTFCFGVASADNCCNCLSICTFYSAAFYSPCAQSFTLILDQCWRRDWRLQEVSRDYKHTCMRRCNDFSDCVVHRRFTASVTSCIVCLCAALGASVPVRSISRACLYEQRRRAAESSSET